MHIYVDTETLTLGCQQLGTVHFSATSSGSALLPKFHLRGAAAAWCLHTQRGVHVFPIALRESLVLAKQEIIVVCLRIISSAEGARCPHHPHVIMCESEVCVEGWPSLLPFEPLAPLPSNHWSPSPSCQSRQGKKCASL